MIECRIQGIPCLIDVDHYKVVKGSFRRDEVSDLDYHGYTECDYTVYDRKGYKAAWLEAKITEQDDDNICTAIAEYLG